MIEAKQVVTEVTFTLQGFAAKRLLEILHDESYSDGSIHDDTYNQLQKLTAELDDVFGKPAEAVPATPQYPKAPITMVIPRTHGWNVFEVRSHLYKYLRDKGFEYLSRPEDIKVEFAQSQEALGLA